MSEFKALSKLTVHRLVSKDYVNCVSKKLKKEAFEYDYIRATKEKFMINLTNRKTIFSDNYAKKQAVIKVVRNYVSCFHELAEVSCDYISD
ncbi:MAG: hypothetical protein KC505_02250 [Myxococcales bacterium]|nr:hypothetical protein [Myxococcales bacterium]